MFPNFIHDLNVIFIFYNRHEEKNPQNHKFVYEIMT